jgi:hypothetical protein
MSLFLITCQRIIIIIKITEKKINIRQDIHFKNLVSQAQKGRIRILESKYYKRNTQTEELVLDAKKKRIRTNNHSLVND